jgi:hypothetical protein
MDFVMTLSESEGEDVLPSDSEEERAPPKAPTKKAAFVWDEDADPVPEKIKKTLAAPGERFSALNYKIQDRLRKRKEFGMGDGNVSDDSEDEGDEDGTAKAKGEEDSDDAEDEGDDEKDEEEAEEKDDEDDENDEDDDDDDDEDDDEGDDEGDDEEKASEKTAKKAKKVKEARPKKSKVIQAEDQKEQPVKHKTFESLGLSRPLMRAIRELDWITPTPVQSGSIPAAMAGRDLLVNAVRLLSSIFLFSLSSPLHTDCSLCPCKLHTTLFRPGDGVR